MNDYPRQNPAYRLTYPPAARLNCGVGFYVGTFAYCLYAQASAGKSALHLSRSRRWEVLGLAAGIFTCCATQLRRWILRRDLRVLSVRSGLRRKIRLAFEPLAAVGGARLTGRYTK